MNIIQLLVFEDFVVKVYRCMKGDIVQTGTEGSVAFHTSENHNIDVSQLQLICYSSLISVDKKSNLTSDLSKSTVVLA